MDRFASDLIPLHAVAVATLNMDGTLVEANAGFLRLVQLEGQEPAGIHVERFFIQPDFATLVHAQAGFGGEIHCGLLTIGDYMGTTRSLRGRIRRVDAQLCMVAEYDIEELERVNATVFELNRDYADMQFELAQANLKLRQHELELRQLNEELEQRVEERTQDLRDALTRAEAAHSAKTLFLANVNHELRTPMNAILGLSGLLARQVSEPQFRVRVEKIEGACRQLLGIVNEIIDMSDLQANRIQIVSVDFELESLLDAALDIWRGSASAKGLVLEWKCDPSLPKRLRGDPRRLGQILGNLLSNAIKFSGHGYIGLRVSLAENRDGDVLVRFEVEDQGIGIDQDRQALIFNIFEQADGSRVRLHGGIGLGLAICKQLCNLMEGEIGVRSVPGQGSLFWFSIPLGRGAGAVAQLPNVHKAAVPALPKEIPERDWDALRQVIVPLIRLIQAGDYIHAYILCDEAEHMFDGILGERADAFNQAIEDFDLTTALSLLQALQAEYPQLRNPRHSLDGI